MIKAQKTLDVEVWAKYSDFYVLLINSHDDPFMSIADMWFNILIPIFAVDFDLYYDVRWSGDDDICISYILRKPECCRYRDMRLVESFCQRGLHTNSV